MNHGSHPDQPNEQARKESGGDTPNKKRWRGVLRKEFSNWSHNIWTLVLVVSGIVFSKVIEDAMNIPKAAIAVVGIILIAFIVRGIFVGWKLVDAADVEKNADTETSTNSEKVEKTKPYISAKLTSISRKDHLEYRLEITNGPFFISNIRVRFSFIDNDYLEPIMPYDRELPAHESISILGLPYFRPKVSEYVPVVCNVYYSSSVSGKNEDYLAVFRFMVGNLNENQTSLLPESSSFKEGVVPSADDFIELAKQKFSEESGSICLELGVGITSTFMFLKNDNRYFEFNPATGVSKFLLKKIDGDYVELSASLNPNQSRHIAILSWSPQDSILSVDGQIKQFP